MIAEARALVQGGARSILIQSPTGSGKTVMVAKMLHHAASKGYPAWFNVHRRELVKQSVFTLCDSAGMDVGVVAAGFPGDRHQRVQVCSIGSLRTRVDRLEAPKLIIWDEAHHLAAKSWGSLHAQFPAALHIGLTATPQRLDGRGLRQFFQHMILGPSVAELIDTGYLCPYVLYAPPPPKLDTVHKVAGDYNRKELSAAMEGSSVTGDVIAHYQKRCASMRMVLFAWSVESSMMLAERFRSAGISAAHVDGDTEARQRDDAIDSFKRGDIKVLCNVDLFGEGFDVPAIEAVALLRPTQSLGLYLQQVGRALRILPGKAKAVILDHAGNSSRFGLPDDPREWSLDGIDKKKRDDDAIPLRVCPKCFAALRVHLRVCSECGHAFEVQAREIEQLDGELEEIDTKQLEREQRLREQGQARTLEDLIKIGELRGYKNPAKWAGAVYGARQAKKIAREAETMVRHGVIV
jgi:DNA repair protein RadD